MADENELSLVIRLQDQATATIKTLGTTLENLAKSAGTATSALNKQAEANDKVAKSAENMGLKAKALDLLHEQFTGTLGRAQKAMSGYAEGAGKAGEFLTAMGVGGVAAAAAVGLLVEKGYEGVAAWSAWEKQALKFDAAMKATGNSAKASFAQLNQEAREIGKGTIFDNDAVTQAMAKLARSPVLTMDKIKQMMPKILDISASTGRDLGEVTADISRLYSNPERAIQMMARTNPNMLSSDRRKLQDQIASGDSMGASDAVLAKMAAPAKGMAETLTGGISGSYKELQKNLSEWTEASNRSFGKMISDALHLEEVYKNLNKAAEYGKEAAENRLRGLIATTPQDRIAGAQQRIRDLQTDPSYGINGVGAEEGGAFGFFAGKTKEDSRIAEQRAIIEQNQEEAREQAKAEAFANNKVQNKLYQRDYSNAADILERMDNQAAAQKKLNQEIAAYQKGLDAIAKLAPGTFDDKEVERMRAALVKTKNELSSIKSGFDALKASIPSEVFAAGLSPAEKAFNDEYTKSASKVGEKFGLTADQLSLDPATREANPNTMDKQEFKNIMDELFMTTLNKLKEMGDAQFARDQDTRSRELALILRSQQPGMVGQQAAAELSAMRSAASIPDAAQRQRAEQADIRNTMIQNQYRNQIEMQQALQKFSIQADQARLQTALLTGSGVSVGGGTFTANGSSVASDIAAQLRTKYGASDTAIAAVLGHFQQESGLDSTKEHLDSNGFMSKGLAQWQKDRAANLEAFAGVNSGGQASSSQQIDFMMKEIMASPKFRAMWARMNAPGMSQDAATDEFGAFEGYGDNSGATRRANARRFISGGALTVRAGAPMGDDLAKRQANLLPQVIEFASKYGISNDEAFAMLSGADAKAFTAENEGQLVSIRKQNATGLALNAAQASGGAIGRRNLQFGLDAFNKGFTGAQGDAYVSAQKDSAAIANNKLLLDKVEAQRETNELTNKEAELAGASVMERQRELDLLKLSQEAKKAGYDTDSQAYKDQVAAINASAEAQERLRRAQGPLGAWLADSKEDWKTWEDASVSAISSTESGFANLITNTTSLTDGVANLAKSFANLAANAAVKSLFGSVAGAVTGSGMFGSLVGGGAGSATSDFGAAGTTMAAFADGGIMGPMGSIPLRRYASGGVATSPQLALFGEGSHNEAYVPLPDGRSIPVTMGGGGGNQSIFSPNISVNVTTGGGPGGGSGAQGGDPKAMGEAVAAALKAQMVSIMTEESRPGGALNPTYG